MSTIPTTVPAVFEYVYPDEDGGSAAATVDLATGVVTLAEPLPDDVHNDVLDSSVRTRIWVSSDGGEAELGEGDDLYVYFVTEEPKQGSWAILRSALRGLRETVGYVPAG